MYLHPDFSLALIYFLYGLAFFSMGLAVSLEANRFPLLTEARILRPLAAFGLLHRQSNILLPPSTGALRLGLLVTSFMALIVFSVQVLRTSGGPKNIDLYIGIGWLLVYLMALLILRISVVWDWQVFTYRADVLARYIFAVPGGLLGTLALWRYAQSMHSDRRVKLARYFSWTALGFLFYALTQIVVPRASFFPANVINSAAFLEYAGFPIQGLRTVLALGITISLIQVIKASEEERSQALQQAHQDRLDALDKVQVELTQRETMRRGFLRRIMVAQEEERARISRELHDETAQTLTALNTNLAAMQRRVPDDPEVQLLSRRIQQFSEQISKDLHHLVHELQPAQLEALGLTAAVKHLADEMDRNYNIRVTVHIDGAQRRLPPLVRVICYRIVQESLTNIARHAQATQAAIKLQFVTGAVKLSVSDNGQGFDVPAAFARGGTMGLLGMQERAEVVQGVFKVESSIGAGTAISAAIPTHFPEQQPGSLSAQMNDAIETDLAVETFDEQGAQELKNQEAVDGK
jgi:signal transduction histidine kinase